MAQLVKHPTLDFGSGHDLRVLGSSPTWAPQTIYIFNRSKKQRRERRKENTSKRMKIVRSTVTKKSQN